LEKFPTQQGFITNQHSLTCTQSKQDGSSSRSSSSSESKDVEIKDQLFTSENKHEEGECYKEMDLDGEQLGTEL
jgi:hypothetical protein